MKKGPLSRYKISRNRLSQKKTKNERKKNEILINQAGKIKTILKSKFRFGRIF